MKLDLGREIREEIKLEVKGEFIPIWTQSGSKETKTAGVVLIMAHGYKCKVGGVRPEINLSDEHTGYRWLSPNEFSSIDFGEDENGFHVQTLKAYLASKE